MSSNIEFKVTASHEIVHGSRSTEINARDVLRSNVEFKVTASHEIVHGTRNTEINARDVLPSNTEFKVTASHETVHGSRSTEINARDIMPSNIDFAVNVSHEILAGSRSSMINMPKQGFQHVYKTRKTTCSLQVQAAYKVTTKKGTPQSKSAKIHDKMKLRKIDGLQEVLSSPEHSLNKFF